MKVYFKQCMLIMKFFIRIKNNIYFHYVEWHEFVSSDMASKNTMSFILFYFCFVLLFC